MRVRPALLAMSMAMVASVVSVTVPARADTSVQIGWTGELAHSMTPNPANVLGAPDGNDTRIGAYHYVWVRNFGASRSYRNLERVLGAPASAQVLDRADVIAFENNGGSAANGRGWESSTWFLSDLRRAHAEIFDERTGGGTGGSRSSAQFWTGSLRGNAFRAYFCSDPAACSNAAPVVSWILIDAPDDIDVHSKNFSVWVSGALLGQGSPDPDAIGLIRRPS